MFKTLADVLPLSHTPLAGPDWGMAGTALNACRHGHHAVLLEHPYTTLLEAGIDGNKNKVHTLDGGIVFALDDHTALIARLENPTKPWKGSQPWFVAPAAWKITNLTDFLDFAQTLIKTDDAFTGTANFLYRSFVWPAWQASFSMNPGQFKIVHRLCQATLMLTKTESTAFDIIGSAFFEAPALRATHPCPLFREKLETVLNAAIDDDDKYSQGARCFMQFGKRKTKTFPEKLLTYHPQHPAPSAHDLMETVAQVSEILHAKTP